MKTNTVKLKALNINLSERNLSILIHSLFSSWMLAFLFQGLIFQSLAIIYMYDFISMTLWGGTGIFLGLLLSGLFIKTKEAAKRLFLFSYMFFLLASVAFFFPPSIFWTIGIIISSLLSGGCVASWAFYLKSSTPKNKRIKSVADMLILSNIIMILLNMTAIHISPSVGLVLSMAMLFIAFILSLKLPVNNSSSSFKPEVNKIQDVGKHLAFLYLFITIITIDSGLMYYVISPAFTHLEWLTSWYWAIPYVVALLIMRNLPCKVNREYILYVAIAMIGFSFIGFMIFDRSILSYIVVNTLMLGAFGIYDLFWWSILGEMLDYDKNPAKILGIGLSANILGVLLGGLICNTVLSAKIDSPYPALLAITVVFVTLILLPPLYRYISVLLKDNTFASTTSKLSVQNKIHIDRNTEFGILSERECQVTALLLQGKTYRTIAKELHISENTVKYYVKNIYSKFNINSRAELIDIILKKQSKSEI